MEVSTRSCGRGMQISTRQIYLASTENLSYSKLSPLIIVIEWWYFVLYLKSLFNRNLRSEFKGPSFQKFMSIAWRLESFYCSGAVSFLIDKELEMHISFVWLVLCMHEV